MRRLSGAVSLGSRVALRIRDAEPTKIVGVVDDGGLDGPGTAAATP
jgi:hypothetical protein